MVRSKPKSPNRPQGLLVSLHGVLRNPANYKIMKLAQGRSVSPLISFFRVQASSGTNP